MTLAARTAGQMLAAAATATALAVIALLAIARVEWPAYNSSNQLHALTTVGQFFCLAGVFAAGVLWRRGRRLLARIASVVFLSAFSVVTLAMPLGATRLYLFGISVDQQFRTEYLTRLADSPALHDMTYIGLPPYYPAGWFWVGGRMADLTGMPAWEMFKPWAIISITAAIAVALVLWTAMVRFETALAVTTATAAVTLAYTSSEPYAAVITVLLPPVFVLAWSGLKGVNRSAIVAAGLFLGVAALFYTLLLAYAAFTITLMALVLAVAGRSIAPLLRLLVIAGIAGALALLTWAPYLLAALRGAPADTGTARHYLPMDGAELTFPMLDFTLLGALCMLGTIWLVVYARRSSTAGPLAVGVLAVYAWSLLSMLYTLLGTTLLSFRLQPTLSVLLAAAGTFGFIWLTQAAVARYQHPGRHVVAVAATIGLIGGLTFSQDIPDVLRTDINVAYTDTDGYGARADRRPPGAEQYYRALDERIREVTGRPPNETVVLTADYSFLSFYPYYGFQGLTSHYANPLAQFEARSAAIESWALLTTPEQFATALDQLPWPAPTVFLMRRGGPDSYTLRLAADVYPNQPNVRRYQVSLDPAIFDDQRWDVSTEGPFVLAIRKPQANG